MKATPLFAIWALSLIVMILFANSMNAIFWISFAVFGSCCVYIAKNEKRLTKEVNEK